MENKNKIKITLISGIIIGLIIIVILYLFNSELLIKTYNSFEGSFYVVTVILIRIIIMALMTYTMFRKWFKAEHLYLDDIPFLFAMFFLILTYGKFIDLFNDFIYYQLDPNSALILLKSRLFILIFDLIPMIYLSIGMLLYFLSTKDKYSKLQNESYSNKIRLRIIILIILVELLLCSLAPNTRVITFSIPIIAIPSLITIVWLFSFAYKNKRISEVNSLILSIGFTLLLISQIIRPIIQAILGDSALAIIIVEIVDLIVFIIIFIGFSMKANFSNT